MCHALTGFLDFWIEDHSRRVKVTNILVVYETE